jgi:hypothetical protein
VTLDRKLGVFGTHPLTVVLHDDLADPTASDANGDRPRAGVDGVFDQLLDYRRRPLDDLAGADLFDSLKVKQVNTAHGLKRKA